MSPNSQSQGGGDVALDAEVRRVDEDRWLASRFAPAPVRAGLIALYAVNHEIARTADVVREPGLGHIRLQWWRDALGDPARANEHPALGALKAAGVWDACAPLLQGAAAARVKDFEAAPFPKWTDADAYLDATAGAVLGAALEVCGAGAHAAIASPGGRAWGFAGILRAAPYWRAKGRAPTPGGGGDDKGLRDRALAALERARALALGAPQAAFPAFAYLALVRPYLDHATPPMLFRRQLRLIWAIARGRI